MENKYNEAVPKRLFYYLCFEKKKKDKHNAELQRADPGTKDMGYFCTRGSIFPHDAQNRFLSFPSF